MAPDELEIHCHGGKAAAEAICEALAAAGAALITPVAWAYQQEADPLAADALVCLADARTERTAAILLNQYRGALRRELIAINAALTQGDPSAAEKRIEQLLTRADLGLHLTRPWKVVIAGRPNVGKSSLMNAILGYQRAIVWREPGTTRDVLTATTAIDGRPIELIDAAGLRREGEAPAETIEAEGIARAKSQIAVADLIIFVADITTPWDETLFEEVRRSARRPPLIAHNKYDLCSSPADGRPAAIKTSALTGHGIDELCRGIADALVPASPGCDVAVPFTAEQIASLQAAADALNSGHISAARELLAPLYSNIQ